MSTPSDQPSAYPYPGPQSQGGYGTPPPGSPSGVPGQQPPYQGPNPYNQPTQAGPPAQPGANPYLQPAPGYAPGAPYPPAPSPAGGGGGGGRKVMWALVGAAGASVLWAAGVFGFQALGGDDGADLGAYAVKDNLCQTADLTEMKKQYPQEDDDPNHDKVEHKAVDSMRCSLSLKAEGSEYSDAYLSISVDLHKKTDPAAEFEATWESYSQYTEKYKVEEVDGFGDKAYLVTQSPTEESSSSYAALAVRDGWMTYSMTWSAYPSSLDDEEVPTLSEITEKLKTDTRATLQKLQS